MGELPDNLQVRCPHCSRALHPVPLMRAASLLCRRTCRCGARWRLLVSVKLADTRGTVHVLDWTKEA